MSYLSNKSDRSLPTGLLEPQGGDILSESTPTSINIVAGSQQIADGFTNLLIPRVDTISWDAFIDVTIDNITTQIVTFVYINRQKQIIQEPLLRDKGFLRDNVLLGIVNHDNLTSITGVSSSTQVTLASTQMTFADLSTAMAPMNATQGDRNQIIGMSGSLQLGKLSGEYYNFALNDLNDKKSPNTVFSPAINNMDIVQVWRSSPSALRATRQKDILTRWDDGTATDSDSLPQGILGDDEWVNHRFFEPVNEAASGNDPFLTMQVGQRKYSSKLAALQGFSTEFIEIFNPLKGAPAVASVTVRGGSTDASDPCDIGIKQAIPARSDWR